MSHRERTHWPAILTLVLVGVSAALEFAKVSTVFEDVRAVYQADSAVAAWFVSLPAVMTILFGLTASVLASRIGFRRTVIASLALAVALSVIEALTPALPLFVVARVLDGVVQLGIVVACPVLILAFAAPQSRALAMALWGSFFGCAFTLSGWIAPRLSETLGVPAVFLAHALLAGVLLVLVTWALPRVAGDGPSDAAVPVGFVKAHRAAYSSARSVLPGAIFIFHTALYAVFVLYVPSFAGTEAAALLLFAMPLSSIVGTLISGVLTSRFGSPPVVLLIGFGGVIVLLAAMALTLGLPSLVAVLAIVLMLFSGLVQGASFSLMPALSGDPLVTAEANGVLMQLGNTGTLIGPPLFAWVMVSLGTGPIGFISLSIVAAVGGGAVTLRALRLTGSRPVSA